jgi:putative two-component system hydrogenase maturation factor HypX/HoxX
MTARLTSAPFEPIGAHQAVRIGLLDDMFGATLADFTASVRELAERVAGDPGLGRRLEQKRAQRTDDELTKPLHTYRREELARSQRCFFGPDPSYHEARHRFVHKLGNAEGQATPRTAHALALNANDPGGTPSRRKHSARSAA